MRRMTALLFDLFFVFHWGAAAKFPEHPVKAALVGKAAGKHDLRNGKGSIGQQFPGFVDSQGIDIFPEIIPKLIGENFGYIALADKEVIGYAF